MAAEREESEEEKSIKGMMEHLKGDMLIMTWWYTMVVVVMV